MAVVSGGRVGGRQRLQKGVALRGGEGRAWLQVCVRNEDKDKVRGKKKRKKEGDEKTKLIG
jgi:hypothetical protein